MALSIDPATGDTIYDIAPIEWGADCTHPGWRWLDCEECQNAGAVCDIKICIDCGMDIPDTLEEAQHV